jgi:hypothetical protein
MIAASGPRTRGAAAVGKGHMPRGSMSPRCASSTLTPGREIGSLSRLRASPVREERTRLICHPLIAVSDPVSPFTCGTSAAATRSRSKAPAPPCRGLQPALIRRIRAMACWSLRLLNTGVATAINLAILPLGPRVPGHSDPLEFRRNPRGLAQGLGYELNSGPRDLSYSRSIAPSRPASCWAMAVCLAGTTCGR